MNTTSKTAMLSGIQLHYRCAGQGALMLFLHGFPEFWYEWRQQLDHFAKTHFVVAPDLRGYNLSSKPKDLAEYSIDKLVADVKELLVVLGYQKMILVAHDWGGLIAWVFASRYPELVENLIILNAPHPAIFERELRTNPLQQKASAYVLMFRTAVATAILSRHRFAALRAMVLDKGMREGFLTAEDQQAYEQAWSQPGAVDAMLNYYRALTSNMEKGDESDWATLKFSGMDTAALMVHVPTLVIWADQDQALLIGNLNGLEKFVPNLTIKHLRQCSHFLVAEASGEINALIELFCEEK